MITESDYNKYPEVKAWVDEWNEMVGPRSKEFDKGFDEEFYEEFMNAVRDRELKNDERS